MGKHIAKLATALVVGALAIAPAAGAYKTPKPSSSGGSKAGQKSSGGAAKKAGKGLQGKTGGQLASKGLSIKVHFPKAGKITCTVTAASGLKLGAGSVSSKKAGSKTLKINFSASGKNFLKTGAGKKVTVKCVFKPKKGKSSTSTVSVKLG